MPAIRILVVDDAVVMRRMITEALGSHPGIEVVGSAPNGRIALQKVAQVNPDLITMDVEMPEMDGVQTVRELRKSYPKLPVIMFSTLTRQGAASTLDALAAGANDYVTKPANVGNVLESIEILKAELVPKILLHCQSSAASRASPVSRDPGRTFSAVPVRPFSALNSVQAFVIGCSTGGPNALADLFSDITVPLPVPTFIVQHMPPLFTKMLAERLDKNSPNRFCECTEGLRPEPGCVYIAPGGRHMAVSRAGTGFQLHLNDLPPENSCRPSVDVLFRSVAAAYGKSVLALVMTGMGQDGLNGCRHIREHAGQILAQDQATSVVWGMPGCVAEAGLADKVLPLRQIGAEVMRRMPVASLQRA